MAAPTLSRSACRIFTMKTVIQPGIHIVNKALICSSLCTMKGNMTGPLLVYSSCYCVHRPSSLLDLCGSCGLRSSQIAYNLQRTTQRTMFNKHSQTKSSEQVLSDLSNGFHPENVDKLTENRRLKLDSALQEIWTSLSERGQVPHSKQNEAGTSEDHLKTVGSLLAQKKIALKQMVYYCTKYPQILSYSIKSWESAVQNALDLGYDNTEILPMLATVPDVWDSRSTNLTTLFDALMSIGFYSRQAHKMLLSYPGLLKLKPRTLIYNHQQLLQLFPKADLAKMIIRSPEVLATGPSETLAKFDYAQRVMGIQPKHLSSSNFLSKDLLYLETRHKFMERAGLYETPDKRGITKVENPTFKNIADTDDRYFAVRVCGLTLAEYRAFVRLYKLERDSADETLSSDDEDYGE